VRDCGQGRSVSKGILQYDMWGVTPTNLHDWAALKAKIAKHGVTPPRFSATKRVWRRIPATSTPGECSAASSRWSTSTSSATSQSSASRRMTSRMTSSPLTEASSTSPRSRTKSRSFTRLSGKSLRRMSSSRPPTVEPSLTSPSHSTSTSRSPTSVR